MSDQYSNSLEFITSSKLSLVYSKILKLLEKYQFPATFGFVSGFCLEEDELAEYINKLESPILFEKKDWLYNLKSDFKSRRFEGWSEPTLFKMVQDSGLHHICTHGGMHVPYSERHTPIESVIEDLKLINYFHETRNILTSCIIFPRNQVGYKKDILSRGLKFYREIDDHEKTTGSIGKLIRFSNEFINKDFNSFSSIPKNSDLSVARPLSKSKFMNAKIGLRKKISTKATKKRHKQAMIFASTNKRVAHFYTHPHNFISDPSMFNKLEYFLKAAKNLEEEGFCRIITMKDEALLIEQNT